MSLAALARWAAFGGDSVSVRARATSLLLVALSPWLWRLSWSATLAFTVVLVGARLVAGLSLRRNPMLRVLGWAALALTLFLHLLVWAAAIELLLTLGWTTSLFARAAAAALLAARFAGGRRLGGARVTSLAGAGLLIGACGYTGWYQAERFVECDDYLSVRAPAEVVVPSRKDLAECRPGRRLPLGRFPRFSWDSPDGRRYLFTSQAWREWRGPPAEADTVTGLLCETPASGTTSPRCMGGWEGKSQAIVPIPERKEILVGTWFPNQQKHSTKGGEILVVSEADPMKTVDRLTFMREYGAEIIYQPFSKSLWIFSDRINMLRHRRSDWSELPGGSMRPFIFGHDYDAARDEGVLCGLIATDGSHRSNFVAFHGDPPRGRRLVTYANAPSLVWGLATGCVLDRGGRKAYVMMMNFGVLARFDFDTGRLEKKRYVGVGLRNLAYDPRRRRIYATEYLRHDIVSIDADTFKETERWRVGRYPRDMRLTRDGKALLVGTTVGLVRIRLD